MVKSREVEQRLVHLFVHRMPLSSCVDSHWRRLCSPGHRRLELLDGSLLEFADKDYLRLVFALLEMSEGMRSRAFSLEWIR